MYPSFVTFSPLIILAISVIFSLSFNNFTIDIPSFYQPKSVDLHLMLTEVDEKLQNLIILLRAINTFDIASLSFPLKFASISSRNKTPFSPISKSEIA